VSRSIRLGGGLALLPGLWAVTPAAAQSVDTVVVDLAEAERIAVEGSPLLASARASLEVSRAQESVASRSRFLPEVNLRNVWGPVPRARGEFNDFGVLMSPDTAVGLGDLTWFTEVELSLVQPLYTFGKLGSRITAARRQVDVTQAEIRQSRAELLAQVRQLYWQAVLTQELVGLAESMGERVAEAEGRLQELYDEGEATQNDMFKFRIFQYEVSSQTREASTGRTKTLSALRSLIGLPDEVTLAVATESLEPLNVDLDSLSTYIAEARANRAELAQLEAGVAARRALLSAARADRWPSLFLAGEYKFNESPDRFDPENPFLHNPTNFSRAGVVLGFEWDLNLRRSSAEAQVARYELLELEARARPLRLQVAQQVREAYLEVVRARADVDDGRDALRASENLLRAEMQTFDIGIGDIEDVIDAFKSNVAMALEQFENIARLNSSIAELRWRIGRDLG